MSSQVPAALVLRIPVAIALLPATEDNNCQTLAILHLTTAMSGVSVRQAAVSWPVKECHRSGFLPPSLEQRHLFRHKGPRSDCPASEGLSHYFEVWGPHWNTHSSLGVHRHTTADNVTDQVVHLYKWQVKAYIYIIESLKTNICTIFLQVSQLPLHMFRLQQAIFRGSKFYICLTSIISIISTSYINIK